MDTQTIELLGRSRLVTELLRAGLEVAMPARDRGVDLIAYVDLTERVSRFVASPIQMKAATTRSFGIYRKYERISNLISAHVWHLGSPQNAVTYALRYKDAMAIGDELGWTKTPSWVDRGTYTTSNPSKKLCDLLSKHRMSSEGWWELIAGTSGVQPQSSELTQ